MIKPKKRNISVRKLAAELEGILAVVRLVPPQARLRPYSVDDWESIRVGIEQEYPKLRRWCFHNDPATEDHMNPGYRYALASSWIEALRHAVTRKPIMRVPVIAIADPDQDRIRIDNRLFNLLDKIELSRLRECPECSHVYYQKRSDQGHCGNSKCKSRLSSRNFYDKPENKERVKQYYQAKKRKAAKKKRAKTASKR